MGSADTQALIDALRLRGAETTHIEVKAAEGGCPKSLRETLSAFSNTKGGTILLGLTDGTFEHVAIDARALRDAVAGMASDELEPPVRAEIDIETLDNGHTVVRVDVPELDPTDKPCYVRSRGKYGGSYTRAGDGDRRLTNYEVDRLLENRKPPEFDKEPVVDASLDDLDPRLLDGYVNRMTESRPRAFEGLDHIGILRRLTLVTPVGGELRPTLAALLAFGRYPQQFFPQLCATVVALPTTEMGELGPGGERFLDNQLCDGPLPVVAATAIDALKRNMTRASVVTGIGRTDRLEYPVEVVRELVVNALLHRDYSPGARGSQVQIELYPDRLVVRSPGGFYGTVDPSNFGDPDVSSSRNALLARVLSETPSPGDQRMLAENRGSGIPTVLRVLNAAGMAPPEFLGDFRRVQVTIPHHALLTPEVLDWIHDLGQESLTQAQIQALALMRSGAEVRNQTLRGWGLHPTDATRELTDLVRRGLAEKIGDRRGASYQLRPENERLPAQPATTPASLTDRQARIVDFARSAARAVTSREVASALDIRYGTAIVDIGALIEMGLLVATAPPRSRHRAYRIAPGAAEGE